MLQYLNQQLARAPQALGERVLIENVSRRSFLKGTASGVGLVVAMQLVPFRSASAFEQYPTGGLDMPNGIVADPHVFVSIDPDGTVTIVAHRSEMGTGSRTSLPMVLADELEADWARVKIVQAPGDEPKYGNQDTDGSRSMRHHIQPMRQMGAAVRSMLEQAAATEWGVNVGEVKAVNHEVVHEASGRKLGYGDLAEAAMALPVPAFEDLAFKDESEFRYIGKGEVQIYDLHDITTGKAIYGADVSLPGQKYAVIARPPVVGGKVKSVDSTAALAIPGVEQVVEIPSSMPPAKFAPLGGVAVVAANTWAALQGRDALQIEWDDGPHAVYNTEQYHQEMSATAAKPGKVIRNQGDVDAALASADRTFSAEYYQPHMAHIAMEPPVALANVADGKAEIWAPVQSPWGTRQDVAETLGVPVEDVTVNVTLLGGGFGRKSKCDYALEAAILSKEVGAPVRVQWTREDDVRHSFYHTTSVERVEAAIDPDGKVTGWLYRSVAPSIISTFAEDTGYQFPIEFGMGFADMPFDIANVRCENGQAMAHTRIGWFRSVSNVPRAFAVQSFAAELAHELGRDQKESLLELIGPARIIDPKAAGMPEDLWNYGEPYDVYPIDTGRLRGVVELAAEKAGWGKQLPAGEGLGIAAHRSFVTYVASVVRVKVEDDGTVRVPEVHTAIDCGFAANPERIRSQIEGAAVMGMTLALNSAITYENGRVVESNYHDYDVARCNNFPELVVTHIVEHPFSVHASGVGEPGVPPFAPALYNAIFNATGKRLRSLPIGDQLKA
ncbi:MAG TPA: molybdopterin cofactor-binding domain-containing protein [Geminicoccaceae bacterium]|nr:molybdopterin cofactor-binding domain-containing protein [Geminicoccaceae bacterium]